MKKIYLICDRCKQEKLNGDVKNINWTIFNLDCDCGGRYKIKIKDEEK